MAKNPANCDMSASKDSQLAKPAEVQGRTMQRKGRRRRNGKNQANSDQHQQQLQQQQLHQHQNSESSRQQPVKPVVQQQQLPHKPKPSPQQPVIPGQQQQPQLQKSKPLTQQPAKPKKPIVQEQQLDKLTQRPMRLVAQKQPGDSVHVPLHLARAKENYVQEEKPQETPMRNIIYLSNRAELAARAELLAQAVPFRMPYS